MKHVLLQLLTLAVLGGLPINAFKLRACYHIQSVAEDWAWVKTPIENYMKKSYPQLKYALLTATNARNTEKVKNADLIVTIVAESETAATTIRVALGSQLQNVAKDTVVTQKKCAAVSPNTGTGGTAGTRSVCVNYNLKSKAEDWEWLVMSLKKYLKKFADRHPVTKFAISCNGLTTSGELIINVSGGNRVALQQLDDLLKLPALKILLASTTKRPCLVATIQQQQQLVVALNIEDLPWARTWIKNTIKKLGKVITIRQVHQPSFATMASFYVEVTITTANLDAVTKALENITGVVAVYNV